VVTLRPDENRYQVDAGPAEQALLRRVPGGRWNNITRRWQFPRQRGVILALDLVFGPNGWQADPLLEPEIAGDRRGFPPPEAAATLSREGTQLRVQCTFNDRELVKAVPGYRWSAPDRCWFLPAAPVAFDLLSAAFGDHLETSRDVIDYIELKRRDELDAVERARVATLLEPPPATLAPVAPPAAPVAPDVTPADVEAALQIPPRGSPWELGTGNRELIDAEVLGRLATAVERLVTVMERLDARLDAAPALAPAVPAPLAAPAPDESTAGGAVPDWADLLRLSEESATEAASAASRLLQSQGEGASRELRAVAAICLARAGNADRAFGQLSAALGPSAEFASADLTGIARNELASLALAFLNEACLPAVPIDGAVALRGALLAELMNGNGFERAAISSPAAQGLLEQLMAGQPLRTIDAPLSDLVRVLHLVSLARARVPLLDARIASMLDDDTLRADAVGLAVILRTNLAMEAESIDEWVHSWPREERFDSGLRLNEVARRALPLMDRELAPRAALALLATIATLPPEEVSLRDRRELVNCIPRHDAMRRYAEFLAMFRLAAAGERAPWDEFPGYIEIVTGKELATTAEHIAEAYLAGSGPGSAARLLADRAVLACLRQPRGITDPEKHVLDLLPVLGDGSRPDNLLNELGQLLEDGEFRGADMFSREQRVTVYRAALDASIRQGHDRDARDAFHRLVRELQDAPGLGPLRELCADALIFRPLRVPALALQAELLLEEGADATAVAERLEAAMRGRDEDDAGDARDQLLGLQYVYPAFNALMKERFAEKDEDPGLEQPPSFPGRRIVIAGGREYLRKRGDPVLQHWGLKVAWLDPGAAKHGAQAKDLAAGTADLVLVNTACIGHAASGRVIEAARAAGNEPLLQPGNGVGSMLLAIKRRLESAEPVQRAPSKVAEKRRRAGM